MSIPDRRSPDFQNKLRKLLDSTSNIDREGREAMVYILDYFEQTIADVRAKAAEAARSVPAASPDPAIAEALQIARDELTEVVAEAARAANEITTAAQTVEKLSRRSHVSVASEQVKAATRIFESCAFQDITGQRINKVVQTLEELAALISDPGHHDGQKLLAAARGARDSAKAAEASLLGGPQLGRDRPSQADVDNLFNA